MTHGYVYILTNPYFKGLVKVGSTAFRPEERAKKLSANSAVPSPFVVAYEVYVNHYQELEKAVHRRLEACRVNPKREFFQISLDAVIAIINDMRKQSYYQADDHFEAIEILPQLLERYGNKLDPMLVSVRIYQDANRVYLESTKYEYIAGYLKNQFIQRQDLGFICETLDIYHDEPTFKATNPIERNVKKFMELNDISMVNCAGELFVAT